MFRKYLLNKGSLIPVPTNSSLGHTGNGDAEEWMLAVSAFLGFLGEMWARRGPSLCSPTGCLAARLSGPAVSQAPSSRRKGAGEEGSGYFT